MAGQNQRRAATRGIQQGGKTFRVRIEPLAQQGFVTIKADTTQKTYPATVDYNAIFNGAGSVPNTVLLNPDKKTITNLRGIFTSEELKQVINEQF